MRPRGWSVQDEQERRHRCRNERASKLDGGVSAVRRAVSVVDDLCINDARTRPPPGRCQGRDAALANP